MLRLGGYSAYSWHYVILSVLAKELREVKVWLKLIVKAELLPAGRVRDLLDECTQLGNIVGKSRVTAKRNMGRMDLRGKGGEDRIGN